MRADSRSWRRGGSRGRGRASPRPRPASPPPLRPNAAFTSTPAPARSLQLPDDGPIRGQCVRMCSEREQRERERAREISRFERAAGAGVGDGDGPAGVQAVKKYRRAAAGAPTLDPSEVRPPRVLLATLAHLVRVVMPRAGGGFAIEEGGGEHASPASDFLALYEFLSDRMRSVRQDFTVQHVEDASLEAALEKIARFYALAGLRSVQLLGPRGGGELAPVAAGGGVWSDKLHGEQLASALAQLMALYRGQHARLGGASSSLSDAALDRQAEFAALDLLLGLEDARGVALALRRLPVRLRGRERVRRALGAFVALQLGDFRGFLARFEAMELLEQALALRQLPRVWAGALAQLDKALGKQDRVALAELGGRLLLGEDVAAVEMLCAAMNVHVERVGGADKAGIEPTVDSWEQQDARVEKVGVAAPCVFVARFKINRLKAEMEASDARKLVRAVALGRVRRRELAAGRHVSDLVMGSQGG